MPYPFKRAIKRYVPLALPPVSTTSRAPLTPGTGSQDEELVRIMASQVHTFHIYSERNNTGKPTQSWLHA